MSRKPLSTKSEQQGFSNMYLDLEQGSVIAQANESSTFRTVTLILSSIGIWLSISALVLLLTTAGLFPVWRRNYKNQLLIQFMFARCLYTFVRYFFDLRNLFQFCGDNSCIIYLDEFMMIYSEIVLIAWMFVFSRQMHSSLVKVFSPEIPSIWKVSLPAWIAPIIVTLTMYGLYYWQNGDDRMIFFLYLAIFKWPVLVANATVLIMILVSITKPNRANVSSASNKPRLVVTMCFLIFFFGFQQVFLDVYKIVYIYFNIPSFILFTTNIATIFHCAFAIMFWVFGNSKTRRMWRNKLCSSKRKIPLRQQSSIESTE